MRRIKPHFIFFMKRLMNPTWKKKAGAKYSEGWDILEKAFKGTEQGKQVHPQLLYGRIDAMKMKETKDIFDLEDHEQGEKNNHCKRR